MSASSDGLVCHINALTPAERDQHHHNTHTWLAQVLSMAWLVDGYQFTLPVNPSLLAVVAQFIAYERLCCPFLRFELTLEPQATTLNFSVTAPNHTEQVHEFVAAEWGDALPKS